MTPYHYAGNNPIGSNDPSGALAKMPGTTPAAPQFPNNISISYWGGWALDYSGPDDLQGGPTAHNPYADAFKVETGQMTPDEYAQKYGSSGSDGNFYLVYDQNENADGSVSTTVSAYLSHSDIPDAGSDFSSNGAALGFAIYKNGWGSDYQDSHWASQGNGTDYSALLGPVESMYGVWENDFNRSDQKWGYSTSAKGGGLLLQAAIVAMGTNQLYNQIN